MALPLPTPSQPPAHIILLGASGRTGRLVLSEALSRSHLVTALVRDPSSITPRPNLHIIQGTPLHPADLAAALASITLEPAQRLVLISTLAQTRASGSPWAASTSPHYLMADCIANVIAVAKEDGRVERLVVMSMFGTGESFGRLMFAMRWVMRWSNMRVTVEDHDLVDERVKRSGLNFVLVRAAMLKGEENVPIKDLGDEGQEAGSLPSISRVSVAGFLLDAAEKGSWDGRTPVVAN
jgi:nucleoside-diphosphate-sugar epimerase